MTSKKYSVRANVKDLRVALHALNKVIGRTPVVPATGNVIFESVSSELVSVAATNLKTYAKMNLVPGEMGISSQAFTAPFHHIYQLIRKLKSDEIGLEFNQGPNGRIVVLSDEGDFFMTPSCLADNFPKMPRVPAAGSFAMKGHELKEGLRLVDESVSTDDYRPSMNYINCQSHGGVVRFVATDGMSLALFDSNTSYSGPNFFLPKTVLHLLRSVRFNKSSYAFATIGTNNIQLSCDDMEIVSSYDSSLVFPDYLNALPNYSEGTSGSIIASEFKYRLGLSKLFETGRSVSTGSLKFENNELLIMSGEDGEGFGSALRMPIEYAHNAPCRIGFNFDLLLRGLRHCDDRVSFKIAAPNRGVMFEYSPKYGNKMSQLVMPTMLSQPL